MESCNNVEELWLGLYGEGRPEEEKRPGSWDDGGSGDHG